MEGNLVGRGYFGIQGCLFGRIKGDFVGRGVWWGSSFVERGELCPVRGGGLLEVYFPRVS